MFIGISYAMKRLASGAEYSTCCSQVFDPDGTGFRFVAYDAKEFTQDRARIPYLSYYEMQSVLSRSLEIWINEAISGSCQKRSRFIRIPNSRKRKFLALLTAFAMGRRSNSFRS